MDKGTTAIIAVLVFGLGLMIGYYAGSNNMTPNDALEQIEEVVTTEKTESELKESNNTATDNTGDTNESAEQEVPAVTEATTVDASQLSAGQRQLLETLGVDTENLTITPAMIACAEAKLGAGRSAEIQNGATPTFMEGASLMACYSN